MTGASRAEIQQVLLQAGWSKDQVAKALNGFSTVDFLVPVPRPRAYLSARDAFLYLLMFGMLYLAAYHLGSLLIQFVNLAIPDAAIDRSLDLTRRRIRFATAALLVSFPLYLFVAVRVNRLILNDPTQRASAIRKWLTYLTLTLASSIIVGDFIYLLNSLLAGELSIRFLLKALVVAGIAAAVFAWHLWTMHDDEVVAS